MTNYRIAQACLAHAQALLAAATPGTDQHEHWQTLVTVWEQRMLICETTMGPPNSIIKEAKD